jgi:hypothetical protein
MPQRVVDALELVDVDIENRELAPSLSRKQLLGMALEQRPVRQMVSAS